MHTDDAIGHSSALDGDGSQFESEALHAGADEGQNVSRKPSSSDSWQGDTSQVPPEPSGDTKPGDRKDEPVHSMDTAPAFAASANGDVSVDAPDTQMDSHEASVSEHTADRVKIEDVSDRTANLQVSSADERPPGLTPGLKREDSTATIPDTSGFDDGHSIYASTVLNDDESPSAGDDLLDDTTHSEATQLIDDGPADGEQNGDSESQVAGSSQPTGSNDAAKERTPSANRLSISYAAGTRRMVIDAGIVEKLRVNRAEALIEVYLTVNKEGEQLKGIMV